MPAAPVLDFRCRPPWPVEAAALEQPDRPGAGRGWSPPSGEFCCILRPLGRAGVNGGHRVIARGLSPAWAERVPSRLRGCDGPGGGSCRGLGQRGPPAGCSVLDLGVVSVVGALRARGRWVLAGLYRRAQPAAPAFPCPRDRRPGVPCGPGTTRLTSPARRRTALREGGRTGPPARPASQQVNSPGARFTCPRPRTNRRRPHLPSRPRPAAGPPPPSVSFGARPSPPMHPVSRPPGTFPGRGDLHCPARLQPHPAAAAPARGHSPARCAQRLPAAQRRGLPWRNSETPPSCDPWGRVPGPQFLVQAPAAPRHSRNRQ